MTDLMLREYGHGIYSLDSGFLRPQLDAIHLIVDDGRAAFVDVGTNYSVPRMLAALAALGLQPAQVDYLCCTHVHLDHAGGAGLMLQQLPNARVVAHPRGAPHLIDPAKLWAGAVAVYGPERANYDYGVLVPVPRERMVEAPDNFELPLGSRRLRFLDTPGHAKHHYCLWDETAQAVFTGDTFGLSYRELDQGTRKFIFPTTTPVQFDPAALHGSLDRIVGLRPRAAYLTHYSEFTELERGAADLHRLIDAHVQLAESVASRPHSAERHAVIRAGIEVMVQGEAMRAGGDPALWCQILDNDIELNAAGLGSWLDSRARKAAA